ncbi:hypothetical protein ACFL6Q_01470 [Candidatus Neomarinimicrobiota bacterium]
MIIRAIYIPEGTSRPLTVRPFQITLWYPASSRGEQFDKTHTKSPILEKAPDGKGVDCCQVSSEPLPGLLNYHLHPSKLLSARAIAARENIGKASRFVVRLVREGLVH